jgi:hypothetical protein
MTTKLEYKLLPKWYYYSTLPDFKWYVVDSKRIVKSNAAEKGKDIGYLQPGDIVWLDFSEQALGWIRVGQVKQFTAPDFVYPDWRKMLNVIQPIESEREAWIEFDLGHVKPYEGPVNPTHLPIPLSSIVHDFNIFGYRVLIIKE